MAEAEVTLKANITQLRNEISKIPGITEAEAKKRVRLGIALGIAMALMAASSFSVARGGILQVNGDALLAAIKHGKVHAVRTELRHIRAHLVTAAGPFDLDYFRASLGKFRSTTVKEAKYGEI